MDPLISIIIPIYNMEAYLGRCLDSVLNNTYRNLELLCVDDGSTDGSLAILRAYAENDARIIVISKENGGVSSARNAALERVRGEYVTFVDPDDYVHPQYIALLLQTIKACGGASIAICDYRTFEETDDPIPTEQIPFDENELSIVNCEHFFKDHKLRSYCGGRLISAGIIGELRFREDLSYSEDSVFIAELAEQTPVFRCVLNPNALYFYFQREDSLVKQVDTAGRMKAARAFAEKALLASEKEQFFLDQAVKRCLSTRYLTAHILPDKTIVRECNQLLRSCRKRIGSTKVYSGKEKLITTAFISIPGLYWLYRSITEPNMWKWEKVERKKRRMDRKKR